MNHENYDDGNGGLSSVRVFTKAYNNLSVNTHPIKLKSINIDSGDLIYYSSIIMSQYSNNSHVKSIKYTIITSNGQEYNQTISDDSLSCNAKDFGIIRDSNAKIKLSVTYDDNTDENNIISRSFDLEYIQMRIHTVPAYIFSLNVDNGDNIAKDFEIKPKIANITSGTSIKYEFIKDQYGIEATKVYTDNDSDLYITVDTDSFSTINEPGILPLFGYSNSQLRITLTTDTEEHIIVFQNLNVNNFATEFQANELNLEISDLQIITELEIESINQIKDTYANNINNYIDLERIKNNFDFYFTDDGGTAAFEQIQNDRIYLYESILTIWSFNTTISIDNKSELPILYDLMVNPSAELSNSFSDSNLSIIENLKNTFYTSLTETQKTIESELFSEIQAFVTDVHKISEVYVIHSKVFSPYSTRITEMLYSHHIYATALNM